MRYWVYTIYDNGPPPLNWLSAWEHHRTEMWFPATKRPRAISAGDLAVIYGSRERGFIAAVKVVGHEPREQENRRFPYVMDHELLMSKAADSHVASAQAAGIDPQRIQRGPHTQITREQYESAVDALVEAARAAAKLG